MDGKVVHRAFDGVSPAQFFQMIDHQAGVEGGRLVVIELTALLVGHVVVALIVVVVADDRDHALKAGDQIVHQGGFAAARAARNADDQNVVVHNLFLHIYGNTA